MKCFNPFPEDMFSVASSHRSEYEDRVKLGRNRMREFTVVVCGLARNVDHILPQTMRRIERLGAMFADYRAVLYENDSHDQTKKQLVEWAARNPKAHILIDQKGDPINPGTRCLKRAERMARYRNICLETIREQYASFSHVVVVDTDLEYGWSEDGVANTFGQDSWDFVGSNGLILRRCGLSLNTYLQYDAWAFRVDERFTPLTTAQVNYLSWQRGEPLVPVTCCFGGLGVYRMSAFLAGIYSGEDTEHVGHQRQAQANGYRNVFLNPSQLTLYGRHRRNSDLWMVPIIRMAMGALDVVQLSGVSQKMLAFRVANQDDLKDSRAGRIPCSDVCEENAQPTANY